MNSLNEGFDVCPFCGNPIQVNICDDEGNPKDESYLDDPWSGVAYYLSHPMATNANGERCPIMTADEGMLGCLIYDTVDELRERWNNRFH